MTHPVMLLSVSTAVPPHVITQRDAAAVAHDSFSSRFEDFERLVKVFESSAILRRHLVRPVEWYLQPLGWEERNAAYLKGAITLFVDAATRALDAAGLKGGRWIPSSRSPPPGLRRLGSTRALPRSSAFAAISNACRSLALAARAASRGSTLPRGWQGWC